MLILSRSMELPSRLDSLTADGRLSATAFVDEYECDSSSSTVTRSIELTGVEPSDG